ncbi:MAG: DUF3822 family protein [Bacteroidaceae bacterium]
MIKLETDKKYRMSIRIHADGFSLFIYLPIESSKPIYTYEYDAEETLSVTANLKIAYKKLPWMSHPFERVYVTVDNAMWTLVPLSLFKPEYAEGYYYQNLPKRPNEKVLHDILPSSDLAILYAIDRTALEQLQHYYGQTLVCYAQYTPLLVELSFEGKKSISRKLFAIQVDDHLQLIAMHGGELELVNQVYAPVPSDRSYYIFNTWRTLGYDQEADELLLIGHEQVEEAKQLLDLLKPYIAHVGVSPSSFNDLDALLRCEML